jgi:crotonobetainyl-CoA:carnitine CoA-transferase CaiB-like acyl-CoA transferase
LADNDSALADLRVLDLGRYWAGPLVGTNLADFGADVVKVESARAPDAWRFGGVREGPANDDEGVPGYERSPIFNWLNRNKRSIAIELDHPRGRAALLRMVARVDVLIENYTPRVMAKFGLDYSTLRSVNPRLVMVSLPGFGLTGPSCDRMSFAYPTEQASGFPWFTGYDDWPPVLWGNAGADAVAGFYGSFATICAVLSSRATGRGVHIDLSQVEALTGCLGVELLVSQMAGAQPPRLGNRDEEAVPSGCFATAIADEYVAVTVQTDEEWAALCAVIDRADLAADPALQSLSGRRAHEARIEAALETWCATREARTAADRLQAVGVPAGPVNSAPMLVRDEALRASGHLIEVERRGNGRHTYGGFWAGMSLTPPSVVRPAPWFGEHNDEVLTEFGFTDEEIESLRTANVLCDNMAQGHK